MNKNWNRRSRWITKKIKVIKRWLRNVIKDGFRMSTWMKDERRRTRTDIEGKDEDDNGNRGKRGDHWSRMVFKLGLERIKVKREVGYWAIGHRSRYTMNQNNQESRRTGPLIRPFARTAHWFACSPLIVTHYYAENSWVCLQLNRKSNNLGISVERKGEERRKKKFKSA